MVNNVNSVNDKNNLVKDGFFGGKDLTSTPKIDLDITKDDIDTIRIATTFELIAILASNEYLRPYINKKYEENPQRYYRNYISSITEDMALRKSMLDIKTEDTYNKLVGIVAEDVKNLSKTDFFDELLKRGYKDIYRYVLSCNLLNLKGLFDFYSKRHKISVYSSRLAGEVAIIANAIAVRNGISLDAMTVKPMADMCYGRCVPDSVYGQNGKQGPGANRLESVVPDEIKKPNNFKSVFDVVNYISTDKVNDPIMADSMMYMLTYMQSIGIDDMSFFEMDITDKDIDIICSFLNYDKGYILSEDSKKVIISSLFVILGMKKRYSEAKDFALNINAENRYKELVKHENSLNSKIEEIESLKLNKDREIEILKMQLREKDNIIDELKNENKKYKSKIEKIEDNSKEVVALREALYEVAVDEYIDDSNSEEDFDKKVELIKDKKIVFFGGSESWIKQIKEIAPNAKFFGQSACNTDISCVKKADAVYINISSLSHAFYYKIMAIMSRCDTKMSFLVRYNKSDVLDEIYRDIVGDR